MAQTVTEEIRVRKGAIHCAGCEATIDRFLSRVVTFAGRRGPSCRIGSGAIHVQLSL